MSNSPQLGRTGLKGYAPIVSFKHQLKTVSVYTGILINYIIYGLHLLFLFISFS